MKVLILGSRGMLGHITAYYFKKKYKKNVIPCAREKTGILSIDENLVVVQYDEPHLKKLIDQYRPCVIINCVGITNSSADDRTLYSINTDFPQVLAQYLDRKNDKSRLIHISTDAVFSGRKGGYVESDQPDAQDKYGKNKLAGEVIRTPHLTIRTSIIGPELQSKEKLLEWFLNQHGEIKGYRKAFWSGVTTLELAKFMDWAISKQLTGLVHVASEKIPKYDLLNLMKTIYQKEIVINPDDAIVLDRSLKTNRADVNYAVPSHWEMLNELKNFLVTDSIK